VGVVVLIMVAALNSRSWISPGVVPASIPSWPSPNSSSIRSLHYYYSNSNTSPCPFLITSWRYWSIHYMRPVDLTLPPVVVVAVVVVVVVVVVPLLLVVLPLLPSAASV